MAEQEHPHHPARRWATLCAPYVFPAYPSILLMLGVLFAYRAAFLYVDWLALAYSCALGAAGLLFPRMNSPTKEPALPRRVRAWCAASVAGSTLWFGLTGLVDVHSMTRRTLDYYDQGAYLISALNVHACGGPLGALAKCFQGAFPATDRDPLFLLILAPFASPGPEFFETGKLIALACGVLAVASAGIVVWRLFDPIAAAVAAHALAMNHFLLKHSAIVNCEPLYVALTMWAAYFAVRGVRRRRLWPASGAFVGLAHLCKGSGILMTPAFGLAAWAALGRRVWREKYVYLFFAAFVVVCLPFFANAAIRYGDPLYNPNSHYMWADSWVEATSLTPAELRQRTFLYYVRTHTARAGFARLWKGVKTVGEYFVNIADLRIFLLKYARGGVVLLLAGAALLADPDRFRKTFFLTLIPLFFLLIGWLQGIGTSEKHILPLVPFVFAYFGRFLSQCCVAGDLKAARRAAIAYALASWLGVVMIVALKGHRLFAPTSL